MFNIDYNQVDEILTKHGYDKTNTISIMQDIQSVYRYLPSEVLSYVATKLKISEAKIYGIATFYGNFSLMPKGKYIIKVCRGTACHVHRSSKILDAIYDATGLSEEKPTSDDGLFTIEVVHCLGACGLAPVVMVNEEVHAAMTPEKAVELIENLRAKEAESNE